MLTKLMRICIAVAVVAFAFWVSGTLARAETVSGMRATSCYGGGPYFGCVTTWHKTWGNGRPRQMTEQERAESAERDRRWVDRCRPMIRQDRYGVDRYHYAAPGCEFGKTHD
jgi:hypothetical protein